MGRSRSLETGLSNRAKADESRAREKATKYLVESTEQTSLDGCLNVEESIKLHEALAQLTADSNPSLNSSFGSSRFGSSDNLYKDVLSPTGSSNNLLQQGASSPVRGFAKKIGRSPSRTDLDIVSAKNSLSQLLRNPEVKPVDGSKRLLMVTVLGSVGPLRALVDSKATVQAVIGTALQIYEREGRLPALGLDSSWFDLFSGHVSFSDALDPFQPINTLNARNFVMVKRQIQREDVVRQREMQKRKKVPKPTSWLEDVWRFGSWWAKVVMSASPAFLNGSDNKSAKAWLHELEAQPAAISSY